MSKIYSECQIIKYLKKGGQKEVFLGEHPRLGKVVLKTGLIKSQKSFERLKRECAFLASTDSKYFPNNYGIEILSDDRFCIIEEFINSTPLTDCLNRFKTEDDIIRLLHHLVVGLDAEVWSKKIVHRDLKPDNILIRSNDIPVIIDLGIARFLTLDSLTNNIAPVGPHTPYFGAPEQLQNTKARIDKRTDIYALGLLVSLLRLGFHPFDPKVIKMGSDIDENILNGDHVDLFSVPGISASFATLANKMIEKEPFKRFRNGTQLKRYLCNNWSL